MPAARDGATASYAMKGQGKQERRMLDGLKYRKCIGDNKILSVCVQKLIRSFISVISWQKKGSCAFGYKDRVIGDQRVVPTIFPLANAQFNKQGAALHVGQHDLHSGICGIDGLSFLHHLQRIVKTDFCLHRLFC